MARSMFRRVSVSWLGCMLLAANVPVVIAQDGGPGTTTSSIINAISEGNLDLNMLLRFETVDDDALVDSANGLTLRTALGYTTGEYNHFAARVLVQDVREVFVDNFNDGTGRSVRRNRYPVIADPSETDFLEGYLRFTGLSKTTLKVGRQIITYRPGPLHRFIGTVGWRQNWQNHDAVTLVNKSLKDTTLSYAYTWNVNRIFTDEAVISSRANFISDSHLVNLQYDGFTAGKLEIYGYFLDFDNAPTSSTASYGARFSGRQPVSDTFNINYAAEVAGQDDYADNPNDVGEFYVQGQLGGNTTGVGGFDSIGLTFSVEHFSGDGTTSFITPLATAHAYQGWADRFLVTPADGLTDWYVTLNLSNSGFNLTATYHDLSSDAFDYDYGNEFDVQLTKALNKHFTVGIKYADYNADKNMLNITRNTGPDIDTSKFWAWLQFSY